MQDSKITLNMIDDNHELSVSNIGKSYGIHTVLKSVSLTIKSGEVIGLLGPNGAGKTTCFSIITGLVAPDSGSLYLDGEDITSLPIYLRAKAGISYLPQESSIFRGLNVEDNIMAILEVTYSNKKKRKDKLEELLNEFSIVHLRYAQATLLSGGERRRLEIARSLATLPKFILLDEPLAGVDPLAIYNIKTLITFLKAKNIGVIINDHNVRETLKMVDRAYIIFDGKVLKYGTPQEIIESVDVQKAYLGPKFKI